MGCSAWHRTLDPYSHAGERDSDDEIITSFIDEGDFYLLTEEERRAPATEIIAVFISELLGALYRSEEGFAALANRQEALHIETRSNTTQHMDFRFDALEAKLSAFIAPTVMSAESTGLGTLSDPAHRELATKIDVARDLINRGLVRSARANHGLLRDEAGEVLEELMFRILTNLGACALADEDLDGARTLLEEAHRLQPENQKGISNAAVAAHLGNDSDRAVALALKARASDPRDTQATAVLIGEIWEAGESERLEVLVAAEEWITRDQQCGLVLATIRMQQSRFQEAVELCRALIEADSEDAGAHMALSRCLLNYAQVDALPIRYTDEVITQLREAVVEAARAIELLQSSELRARRREALVTRAVARALLGETAAAMQDLTEVLDEAPAHSDATFNEGLLLLSGGQLAEARAAFEGIQDPVRRADAALPLAYACVASCHGAAAVRLLRGTLSLERPGWEEVHRAELLSKAEAAIGYEDSVGPAIAVALERHSDDPRLLVLAAVRFDILGGPEGAEDSLLNALRHADDPDRREVLVRLGALYQGLGRFAEAADRLAEVVGDVPWHPAAIPLLVCLANSNRLREALSCARRIRERHPQPPRMVIEVEAQILDQVGDGRAALRCIEDLCSRADSVPVDQVKLASAQFRCGERDAGLKTVLGIDASHLHDESRSMLALAQLKLMLGESGYLEDAYLARRCGLDDAVVHLGCFGLFLGRDKELVEPETVGPGCAVLLKSEAAEQWWRILDDAEKSLDPYELPSSHDLTRQLLGRRAGDIITLRQGLEELSYEIADIQSKFVQAFQETCSEFSTRFPSNKGLSRVKVTEDDFKKVFQSIDQRDHLVHQALRMYMDRRLPFASLASLLGRSALEVWCACTEAGFAPIRFGAGTDEEASEAAARLREADSVVLDLLALLTVRELGLAGHLRNRFRRVAVPQLVIDELQQAYFETVMGPPPTSWLGKSDDGRYTLVELADEHWPRWQEFVRSVLEFAESFERIASYPLLEAGDIDASVGALTTAGAGAVYASDEHSGTRLVLLCDDISLSQVARSLGVHAANTQDMLDDLRRSGVITGTDYSLWIERLVLLNYWFVQVRSEDIVSCLEANGYMTADGTRAMLRTLEGPGCSENSAVSVGAEVVTALVGRAPTAQVELILSLVLATLQRGREMSSVLPKFRKEIALGLAPAPRTRNRLLLQAVDLYTQAIGRSMLR